MCLAGCTKKLERADATLEQAEEYALRFLDSANQFPNKEGALGAEGMRQSVTIGEPEHPSLEFAVIIGDLLHQFRSTLDHLMWQLTPVTHRSPRTEFPIFDCEQVFRDKSRSARAIKNMKCLGSHSKAVVERVQPFKSGDPQCHPLWFLHRLNIIDKHRVLVLSRTADMRPFVTASQQLGEPGVFSSGASGTVTTSFAFRATRESSLMDVSASVADAKVGNASFKTKVDSGIYFGHDCESAQGRPVLPLLREIRTYMHSELLFGNPSLPALVADTR